MWYHILTTVYHHWLGSCQIKKQALSPLVKEFLQDLWSMFTFSRFFMNSYTFGIKLHCFLVYVLQWKIARSDSSPAEMSTLTTCFQNHDVMYKELSEAMERFQLYSKVKKDCNLLHIDGSSKYRKPHPFILDHASANFQDTTFCTSATLCYA